MLCFIVCFSKVCWILCPFLDIMHHLLVHFDHTFNVARLTPLGEPPSPRAAHVATAVGTMVVIQVPSLVVSILLSDECWHINGYHLSLRILFSFRVELALLAYLLRTFMFWILHNNDHDGIGCCYSTVIQVCSFSLTFCWGFYFFCAEWWFKALVLVHDMDMWWPWLGSDSYWRLVAMMVGNCLCICYVYIVATCRLFQLTDADSKTASIFQESGP